MRLHHLAAGVASVALAGALVAAPASRSTTSEIKEIAAANGITELRMTEAGGASGDSIQAGYLEPFQKASGITVIRENPSGLGKLRAMVEAGAVTSVLLELGSPELEQAKALDLVEPLDWDAIDPPPIFEEAKDEYGYGYQYYSTIMAWRADAKAPANWQEFWDVEAFPGQAGAARLSDLHPADGPARRWRGARRSLPARPRPRLREPREDQGQRRRVVAGGRAATAAPPGQRGAIRGRLVGPGGRSGGHRLQLQRGPARPRLLRRAQGRRSPIRRRRRWASSTR